MRFPIVHCYRFLNISVKATTMPPTTPAPKADCEAQADIVFLLDASGSVGSTNFQKVKDFVHDMMNSFNIGPTAVQVGVDTFQSNVKSEFNMNKYSDRPAIQNAINNIQYTAGGTHTGEAIRFVRSDSFSSAAGLYLEVKLYAPVHLLKNKVVKVKNFDLFFSHKKGFVFLT